MTTLTAGIIFGGFVLLLIVAANVAIVTFASNVKEAMATFWIIFIVCCTIASGAVFFSTAY